MTGFTKELESLLKDEAVGNGINTASEHESKSNLIGNEHLLKTLRELENIKALRGTNSRGIRDLGVDHPPEN